MTVERLAEKAFRDIGRKWTPSTKSLNQTCLRKYIVPHFGDRSIASIEYRDVRLWMDSLHEHQAMADRSLPVLSRIMGQAETYGYRMRGTNPCLGILTYARDTLPPLRCRRRSQSLRATRT